MLPVLHGQRQSVRGEATLRVPPRACLRSHPCPKQRGLQQRGELLSRDHVFAACICRYVCLGPVLNPFQLFRSKQMGCIRLHYQAVNSAGMTEFPSRSGSLPWLSLRSSSRCLFCSL